MSEEKKLEDITHRNYEATKRRGLITDKTTQEDFAIKLREEVQELYESDPNDWSELADVALVCFAMAEHYGIDLVEEMRKKTEFNETRPSKTQQKTGELVIKKEINGKTYELVEGMCKDCAFVMYAHGCKLGDNECCLDENQNKHWKEVKDEQN